MRTMRKFIAISVVLVLVAFTALLGWRHFKHLRDERIYKNLAGTWTMSFGSLTVHPDGSYVLAFTVRQILANENVSYQINEDKIWR
jgi:hypothetical protein